MIHQHQWIERCHNDPIDLSRTTFENPSLNGGSCLKQGAKSKTVQYTAKYVVIGGQKLLSPITSCSFETVMQVPMKKPNCRKGPMELHASQLDQSHRWEGKCQELEKNMLDTMNQMNPIIKLFINGYLGTSQNPSFQRLPKIIARLGSYGTSILCPSAST